MTGAQGKSYREVTLLTLDRLGVPDNEMRRLALELAELLEDPDTEAGVFSIASSVSLHLAAQLRDHYRPRTHAEAEVEYLDALYENSELLQKGRADE